MVTIAFNKNDTNWKQTLVVDTKVLLYTNIAHVQTMQHLKIFGLR